ncbi:hypothetical protein QJS04_geneDACA003959 [Acorus gramineus]|uniref:Uncharacterized protein n=1 Tax=Acorus gramineus TaxID=55184 RepID=A0AAV9BJI0_ACOGR|nr:hypothetical protein QJS04_geneDACA003959 [Acorus gramineus]
MGSDYTQMSYPSLPTFLVHQCGCQLAVAVPYDLYVSYPATQVASPAPAPMPAPTGYAAVQKEVDDD